MENNIEEILRDNEIVEYFKDKNIYNFIKTYIEIDKILLHKNINNPLIYDKLEELKKIINIQNNQIDNIKNITQTDIKGMFIELQQQINYTPHLRSLLDNFKDKIENMNNQNINTIDKTFNNILNEHPISNKITLIENNITNINEHFSSNSAKKGQKAEDVLMTLLVDIFNDTEIINTAHISNSGDIQMIKDNKPKILIDSKNFSTAVPKRDLDKFYSDIQQNNCSGILCNSFGGIANKQHFEIDIIDKNILIFIHYHKFDKELFQLAVNIIYNMYDKIKETPLNCINIDDKSFSNLKIEYNFYIQSFRHHLDIIKSNINSLSQLSMTLLDNFFKRKTILQLSQKPFICSVCSNAFMSEKSLRAHMKKLHTQINIERKNRGRPPISIV